jgi:hypothetical protein
MNGMDECLGIDSRVFPIEEGHDDKISELL